MEAFEPPKYLASLIAAVNDGAKSAQAGAFLFLLVGLYLLATAFSASDEDLLLGRAVTISQIGASLPVSFSFAIAPLVFVFLHINTLVRYDLLAKNVQQFRTELRNTVPLEADRERCRQLLANVEFIVALTAPRSSALYSRFWPWLFRSIIAVFPVAVLLLVQINALRYQSDLIVWVQRTWLALDLVALVWFFARNPPYGGRIERAAIKTTQRVVHWGLVTSLPVLIIVLNLWWLQTVPADAEPKVVRYDPLRTNLSWVQRARDPLDLLLCPTVNWGCRFLRVDHRLLVDKVRDEKALGVLRMDIPKLKEVLSQEAPGDDPEPKAKAHYTRAMAAMEGVFLRRRSLRFALLDESQLYAADLIAADLQNASFAFAKLQGAHLSGANLSFADLGAADLSDAYLRGANLSGANLSFANLRGASLSFADLGDAHLGDANLSFADLRGADLSDANLSGANLSFANLSRAKGLTQAQLDEACGKPKVLPENRHVDKPCPEKPVAPASNQTPP
jgi:hypothetical protein